MLVERIVTANGVCDCHSPPCVRETASAVHPLALKRVVSGAATFSSLWQTQVIAEKEAWKIAEEHGLHLVTIHPVFVVGPVLSSRTDATSVQMIKVSFGPQNPGTSL